MVLIISLQLRVFIHRFLRKGDLSEERLFLKSLYLEENGFLILLNSYIPFIYSAKKYKKLYIFMGPTNKIINICVNILYYRSIRPVKNTTIAA
jgi:hypothetical protein